MSKATQKEGLGKDALLTRLGGWFGYYFNINDVASGISQENGLLPEERQAYAQLVKIVEQHFAEQSGEVDEDVQELIDWLQKCIDRPTMLQVSHPHLAWYPTEKDKANWQKVKQLLTRQPVQVDEELVEKYTKRFFDWQNDDLSNYEGDQERFVEVARGLVRELLTHSSTNGNDMSDKRTVAREEVRKFCERGDELEQIEDELVEWFEKLGVMEEK